MNEYQKHHLQELMSFTGLTEREALLYVKGYCMFKKAIKSVELEEWGYPAVWEGREITDSLRWAKSFFSCQGVQSIKELINECQDSAETLAEKLCELRMDATRGFLRKVHIGDYIKFEWDSDYGDRNKEGVIVRLGLRSFDLAELLRREGDPLENPACIQCQSGWNYYTILNYQVIEGDKKELYAKLINPHLKEERHKLVGELK